MMFFPYKNQMMFQEKITKKKKQEILVRVKRKMNFYYEKYLSKQEASQAEEMMDKVSNDLK